MSRIERPSDLTRDCQRCAELRELLTFDHESPYTVRHAYDRRCGQCGAIVTCAACDAERLGEGVTG